MRKGGLQVLQPKARRRPAGGRSFGIAAALDARQQFRDHVARGALDLAGIVDGRLAEPFDQIGRQRQHRAGLVDIGDQVDDDIDALPEGLGVVALVLEQREGVGIIVGMLEQIFGRRVAAERRVQRQHPEIRRRLDRPAAGSAAESRRRWHRRPGRPSLSPSRCLMPPIQYRLSASRGLSAIACSKHSIAVRHFLQLVMNLAELMAQLGVLRPLAEQFQQQRLGDDVLLGARSAPAPDWCASPNAADSIFSASR